MSLTAEEVLTFQPAHWDAPLSHKAKCFGGPYAVYPYNPEHGWWYVGGVGAVNVAGGMWFPRHVADRIADVLNEALS